MKHEEKFNFFMFHVFMFHVSFTSPIGMPKMTATPASLRVWPSFVGAAKRDEGLGMRD
jgi:hypothetical protein